MFRNTLRNVLWRTFTVAGLWRVLCALVVITVMAFLCEYHLNRFVEEATYSNSVYRTVRTKAYFKNIDSVNQGCYLKINPHSEGSYTREVADDIGFHVLIADMALLKKVAFWKKDILRYRDLFRIELFVTCCAVLVVCMPVVPFAISVASSLAIFLINMMGIVEWNLSGWWAPGVCVVTVMACVLALITKWNVFSYRRHFPQLLVMSTFAGLLGFLRKDCQMLTLAPLVGLTIVSVLSGILSALHSANHNRAGSPIMRLWRGIKDAWKNRALGACVPLLLVVLLFLLPPLLLHGNIALFEAMDGCDHQPKRHGHHMWHNIYLGVGATLDRQERVLGPFNHENIIYSDRCGVYAVRQERPSIRGYPEAYMKNVRDQYLTILRHNPVEVFAAAFSRVFHYVKMQGVWVCLCAMTFVGLLGIGTSSRHHRLPIARVIVAAGALLGGCVLVPSIVSLAPSGALGLPVFGDRFLHAIGLESFLVVFPLVGLAFGVSLLKPQVTEEGADHEAESMTGGEWGGWSLAVLLILALAMAHIFLSAIRVQSRRIDRLSNELHSGSITLATLLAEYPANAVRAFNRLPSTERDRLARATLSTAGPSIGCEILAQQAFDHASVLQVRWRASEVFVLLKVNKPLAKCHIPVFFDYDGTARSDDQLTYNFVLLLPPQLRPGVWLFSFTANREVKRLVLGAPDAVMPRQYGQPIRARMCTFRPLVLSSFIAK